MLQELKNAEVEIVSGGIVNGGAEGAGYVVGIGIGSVIYAGGVIGGALGNFGSALGIKIYDMTH